MPRLNLHKDSRTGEPVKIELVSAKEANQLDYLVVKAYDERDTKQIDRD